MDIVKSSEKKRAEFELLSFGNDKIEFKIYADKGADMYSFSMPYDEDWHVYVDGKEVQQHKLMFLCSELKYQRENTLLF